MAANTIAMYFKFAPERLTEKGTQDKLYDVGGVILGPLAGTPLVVNMDSCYNYLFVFHGQDHSHATMRAYSHGLVTLDVQYYVDDQNMVLFHGSDPTITTVFSRNKPFQLSEEYVRCLESKIAGHFGDSIKEINCIYAPVRRGQPVWNYTISGDERILECDFEEVVYEKSSRYQNIRIMQSRQFGRVLYLDRDVMLGESDRIYTVTLCNIGTENYQGAEVLILGGGDGGILHELLKEKPKFITMAEIDKEVIIASRKYLRSVCGDSLDSLEGPNHKIIVDDCVQVMRQFINIGKQFDYIINDLTEMPVNKDIHGYGYAVETDSTLLSMSLKCLKPGGKVFSRGNIVAVDWVLKKYEADIINLGWKFKPKDIMVPSFQERYRVYEIWKPA